MILLAETVDRMLVMRNSELIMDATPREVFSDYEIMSSTHLTPPQITTLSLKLKEKYQKLDQTVLTIDEMVDKVKYF
jgi:energy-coupling factor transport system ATP-binding protein